MTKNELRSKRSKRYYASKLLRAINYLYGTPIGKKPLTMAVSILKVLYVGAKRGWLYPEEIAKLTKLVATNKSLRKHAVAL